MPYKFTFDFSRIPRFFFTEITKIGYQKDLHKKLGQSLQDLIKTFKIQEITGLDLSEVIVILQDFIDVFARNLVEKDKFKKSRKRALFLPHCSRKFMDARCKANFNPKIPSYVCSNCSQDCLVNKASCLARKKGCDVYVLPGGSCVSKILSKNNYEGVIGIACGEELKAASIISKRVSIPGQAVPLLKNGCANTFFNIDTLFQILEQ